METKKPVAHYDFRFSESEMKLIRRLVTSSFVAWRFPGVKPTARRIQKRLDAMFKVIKLYRDEERATKKWIRGITKTP